MSKGRFAFAALVMLATMAATAFLPGAPTTEGAETECRTCVQTCIAEVEDDFCWCAIDWCGDVCSTPPSCDTEIE
jgi:hypothetical protein